MRGALNGPMMENCGSSGVGIYLVKTIIDLHQGAILLDSRESKDSCFALRLPASSVDCHELVRAACARH